MIIFPYIPHGYLTKNEIAVMLLLYSLPLFNVLYVLIIEPVIANIKYNKRRKEESKKDNEFREKIIKLIKENESNKSNR